MNKISKAWTHLAFPFFLSSFTIVFGLKGAKCPEVVPIDNFNLNAIEGVWYEIARYPNDIEGDICIGYDLKHNGTDLTFTSVGVPKDSPYHLVGVSKTEINHKGTLIHEVTDGVQIRENIVLMDYDKYFISYECYYDEQAKALIEYSWVYTRTKKPGDDIKNVISKFLKSSTVIDMKKLVWFDLANEGGCKMTEAPEWVGV